MGLRGDFLWLDPWYSWCLVVVFLPRGSICQYEGTPGVTTGLSLTLFSPHESCIILLIVLSRIFKELVYPALLESTLVEYSVERFAFVYWPAGLTCRQELYSLNSAEHSLLSALPAPRRHSAAEM